MFTGCMTFDGNMTVKLLNGAYRTIRTDLGGLKLQKADPNKELLVLTRNHVGFDEIDTGYIVRTKMYDDGQPPYFGLKAEPDAEGWGCHNYCDVIAWGYADGGLNDPTLFYSCQSTVEEEMERERRRAEKGMKTHAEKLAELEAELDDDDDEWDDIPTARRCVVFKMRDDGEVEYHAVVGEEEKMTNNATDLMRDCAKVFCDMRKEHPEVTEMHFYQSER